MDMTCTECGAVMDESKAHIDPRNDTFICRDCRYEIDCESMEAMHRSEYELDYFSGRE